MRGEPGRAENVDAASFARVLTLCRNPAGLRGAQMLYLQKAIVDVLHRALECCIHQRNNELCDK